jgi:addiction module HigA family antidote
VGSKNKQELAADLPFCGWRRKRGKLRGLSLKEMPMQERKIQRKVRPSHPGKILRNMLTELAEDRSDQFGSLTRKELAKRLGVSARIVNELIHERRSMTADMAIRLSRVFKTTPDIWMNLQKAVDLWDASQANKVQYDKLRPIAA